MYPAATITTPHRRSCWAGTQRGKGVVILGLKRGEPRFVAATGVMPHGGSAAAEAEKIPERAPNILSTPIKSTPTKVE